MSDYDVDEWYLVHIQGDHTPEHEHRYEFDAGSIAEDLFEANPRPDGWDDEGPLITARPVSSLNLYVIEVTVGPESHQDTGICWAPSGAAAVAWWTNEQLAEQWMRDEWTVAAFQIDHRQYVTETGSASVSEHRDG